MIGTFATALVLLGMVWLNGPEVSAETVTVRSSSLPMTVSITVPTDYTRGAIDPDGYTWERSRAHQQALPTLTGSRCPHGLVLRESV